MVGREWNSTWRKFAEFMSPETRKLLFWSRLKCCLPSYDNTFAAVAVVLALATSVLYYDRHQSVVLKILRDTEELKQTTGRCLSDHRSLLLQQVREQVDELRCSAELLKRGADERRRLEAGNRQLRSQYGTTNKKIEDLSERSRAMGVELDLLRRCETEGSVDMSTDDLRHGEEWRT